MEPQQPIVFVPMCGEFYHYGHANILAEANKYGNVVVLLMTDEAMISYKRTPYYRFEGRKIVIESVRYVKGVYSCTSFEHMYELIKIHQPQFFVHGTDWKNGVQKPVREKVILELVQYGGKLIEPEYTEGISSTLCYNKATE